AASRRASLSRPLPAASTDWFGSQPSESSRNSEPGGDDDASVRACRTLGPAPLLRGRRRQGAVLSRMRVVLLQRRELRTQVRDGSALSGLLAVLSSRSGAGVLTRRPQASTAPPRSAPVAVRMSVLR